MQLAFEDCTGHEIWLSREVDEPAGLWSLFEQWVADRRPPALAIETAATHLGRVLDLSEPAPRSAAAD